MNKIPHILLALCLAASGSLVLASNAAAADDMGHGSMTMEQGAMGNGAMMEQGAMHKGTMGRGMMKKDTMNKQGMPHKMHSRKKMHQQDRMMQQEKMRHGSMQ